MARYACLEGCRAIKGWAWIRWLLERKKCVVFSCSIFLDMKCSSEGSFLFGSDGCMAWRLVLLY